MPRHIHYRCRLSTAGLVVFVVANWLCSPSLGEPPVPVAAPAGAVDAGPDSPKYVGIVAGKCFNCHTKPNPEDKETARYFDLTEYPTWAEKDKHSLAYKVLANSRSKKMGQLLGITPETDASCLGCHAIDVDASKCAEGNVLSVRKEGVSCEACHGAANKWLDQHWHPSQWRKIKTRQEKRDKGLVDLRDGVTRAEVCLSCHVGNAPGKVVTHEMFAAGHPPISGFEIETFLRAMPKHWKPLADQPPETQRQYSDQWNPDKPETMYATRMMTIGGLVALKDYAGLIGHNARERSRLPGEAPAGKLVAAGASVTELAFYDCQACHHELTVDSWRQKRGYPGRPGRPMVRAWPLALGKLAAAACGNHRAPLLEALHKFYEAIDKQPFGATKDLAAAADQLMDKTEEAIRFVKMERFSEDNGLEILKEICATGTTELPDFETARQLGWTARIVYEELPKHLHNEQIDKVLETITAELSLSIPSRQEEISQEGATESEECVCVANKSVPQTLAAAAKYDPLEFQNLCKRLAGLLASAPKAHSDR